MSTGGSFISAAGIAVEVNGNILVTDANAFGGSGGVIRVNPRSGKQTTVASGGSMVAPLGIAVEPDGNILVADSDAFGGKGGIIRIDPETGEQTKSPPARSSEGTAGSQSYRRTNAGEHDFSAPVSTARPEHESAAGR